MIRFVQVLTRLFAAKRPDPEVAEEALSRPVVALGRGGSGTRLLSLALQEHDVFLGNDLNQSADSLEWVETVYALAIDSLVGEPRDAETCHRDLRSCAETILSRGNWRAGQSWGWKLPETMFIVPVVARCFPGARFVHLVRNPLDTCLRRTHMTSRTTTPVGRAALETAYRSLGWNRDPADDDDHLRNAAAWVYQVESVVRCGRSLGPQRYLEITYEDLCSDPQSVSDRIAGFLGRPAAKSRLDSLIDDTRRRRWSPGDERAAVVWSICEGTATKLGYEFRR